MVALIFPTFKPFLFSNHNCTLRSWKDGGRKVLRVSVIVPNCPESNRLHEFSSMPECRKKKKRKKFIKEMKWLFCWSIKFFHSKLLSASWQCQNLSKAIFIQTLKKVLYDEMCYKNMKWHYGILHLIKREIVRMEVYREIYYDNNKINYSKL